MKKWLQLEQQAFRIIKDNSFKIDLNAEVYL